MYDNNLDRIYIHIWKHVIVWLDLPDQLCLQCKYCRNTYTGLFSSDMIYRHMLSQNLAIILNSIVEIVNSDVYYYTGDINI
jgi:hypothetical protein